MHLFNHSSRVFFLFLSPFTKMRRSTYIVVCREFSFYFSFSISKDVNHLHSGLFRVLYLFLKMSSIYSSECTYKHRFCLIINNRNWRKRMNIRLKILFIFILFNTKNRDTEIFIIIEDS